MASLESPDTPFTEKARWVTWGMPLTSDAWPRSLAQVSPLDFPPELNRERAIFVSGGSFP